MEQVQWSRWFFSSVVIAITLVAFLPNIRSVYRGSTKPHLFSWVIWGSTTPAVIAVACLAFVALVSYRRRVCGPQP